MWPKSVWNVLETVYREARLTWLEYLYANITQLAKFMDMQPSKTETFWCNFISVEQVKRDSECWLKGDNTRGQYLAA